MNKSALSYEYMGAQTLEALINLINYAFHYEAIITLKK